MTCLKHPPYLNKTEHILPPLVRKSPICKLIKMEICAPGRALWCDYQIVEIHLAKLAHHLIGSFWMVEMGEPPARPSLLFRLIKILSHFTHASPIQTTA